jgi:hypothetical protein
VYQINVFFVNKNVLLNKYNFITSNYIYIFGHILVLSRYYFFLDEDIFLIIFIYFTKLLYFKLRILSEVPFL